MNDKRILCLKEIMLRLNSNPTEKPEIQKEDWEVTLQCLIDKYTVLRNKAAREEAKSVRRAYFRLVKFLRSASLLDHPTFNSNTVSPQ